MVARTVLLYVVVLIIFRVMGKREIGELSILDLVVFIMIAEMAVMAIENPKDPLLYSILPMLTLLIIQIGLAIWSLKSNRMRNFIDGKPSIIIENGKINEHEMKRQRYNFNDLLVQLRDKNIKNVADVEFAILESSGRLSVFEKDQQSREKGNLNLPFIIDGIIQEEHLLHEHQTTEWLKTELAKLGYSNLDKISYCSYDNGKFFIDLVDVKQ
ncbi:DUF421 domain-containing protein [Priestia megaterium]|uniref:DUF421 domain-containing protein n=2 Tax=Bacillaceae TaxID=186817 RepID=UPI0006768A6F|nr:DUF421 domain-containing protein [Priestia megaterium]MBM6597084.1 DUF421 domain-containing protein [Priestia megaterium]MCR8861556.1 DUF421 domain-containing protein [Priestia megaterium]MDN3231954.1 DUF421 domain-containing protein [Priestia megaterium]MDR0131351.1 DUF421 domain-containing protein [Priestia megaterium]MED3856393.1 DUF421 domain-containing protein [Priestia megaterium]